MGRDNRIYYKARRRSWYLRPMLFEAPIFVRCSYTKTLGGNLVQRAQHTRTAGMHVHYEAGGSGNHAFPSLLLA